MPKRSSWIPLLTLGLLLPLAGCGPENGELASPPVLVDYGTGDPANTIDGQLGMTADRQATVTGGLGFEGPVQIACGPRRDAFELRLTPEGATAPVLTLRTLYGQHGGGHGDDQGDDHGDGGHGSEVQADLDVGHGDGTHREVSRTAGHPRSAPEFPEATVHLARILDGQLSQASGTGRVEMRAATHAAGRHAVSGSFTAEVAGGTLEGSFQDCYYFTG